MVIHALSKLPNQEGSKDDILEAMIDNFGKDKVCDATNTLILSFEDHKNTTALKNIKTKITKVISKLKDKTFEVQPAQYTFRPGGKKIDVAQTQDSSQL